MNRLPPVGTMNALTIDIEEYFHAEVLQHAFSSDWDANERRSGKMVLKLLDWLQETNQRATFFTLGWVAQKEPDLIKEVCRRGHEVACHGYGHKNVSKMKPDEFRRDVGEAIEAIVRACGVVPSGYRAPTFSLTLNMAHLLEILRDYGLTYDSSSFPMLLAGFEANFLPLSPWEILDGLIEVPLAVARCGPVRVPVAGGAFFRAMPYEATAMGIRRMNSQGIPAVLYFHPWEFDVDQPRVKGLGFVSKTRHYVGLERNEEKFRRLCREFKFCTVTDILQSMHT
jgi:polysaccharide deacetylase family protein (PEP-CTERM system associated)